MEREQIEHELSFGTVDELNGSVVDLISRLQRLMDETPSEFRETAVVEFSWDEYEGYASSFNIFYSRPETDDEMTARSAKHNAYKADVARRELWELERLKEKYE